MSVLFFRLAVALGCFRDSAKLHQQEQQRQRDLADEENQTSRRPAISSSSVPLNQFTGTMTPAASLTSAPSTDQPIYASKFQMPFSMNSGWFCVPLLLIALLIFVFLFVNKAKDWMRKQKKDGCLLVCLFVFVCLLACLLLFCFSCVFGY